MSAIERMWVFLQRQIDELGQRVEDLEARSGVANTTFAFNESTLANAPTGMTTNAQWFITDGRKQGEGAGNGTGIPAYYDVATSAWVRYSDDTAVVI